MSARGRSKALIPGARSAEGSPMSAHGRSKALIPQRAARREVQ